LVFIAQTNFGAPVRAADFAECVRDIANKDFVAKQEFQAELRDLIVRSRPDFKALATLNMDLQIALAEARKKVIEYFLVEDPRRIIVAKGLSKFRNFDWSENDEKKFVQASKTNAQLVEKVEKLKKVNDTHPDQGKMRGYINQELSKNPEFSSLMAKFMADEKRVGDLLSKCPAK
jgi:hypothetical protein